MARAPAKTARPPRAGRPPRDNQPHLGFYLLLCHLLLLGHQAVYSDARPALISPAVDQGQQVGEGNGTLVHPGGGAEPDSYLTVAALTLAQRAGLDVETSLQALSALAAHGCLLILFLVTASDATTRPAWSRLLAPALFALAPAVALGSTRPTEWVVFACLILAAVDRFAAGDGTCTWGAVLWLLLALLARPEGLIFAAVLLVMHLGRALLDGELGQLRTWLGPFVYLVGLAVLLYFRLLYAGGPLLPPWMGLPSALPARELLESRVLLPLGLGQFYLAPLFLPAFIALVLMWRWPLIRACFWLALTTVGLYLYRGAAAAEPAATVEGMCRLLLLVAFAFLLAQEGYAWIVQRMLQAGTGMRRVEPAMAVLPAVLGLYYLAHSPPVMEQVHLRLPALAARVGWPMEAAPATPDAMPAATPSPSPGPEPTVALEAPGVTPSPTATPLAAAGTAATPAATPRPGPGSAGAAPTRSTPVAPAPSP